MGFLEEPAVLRSATRPSTQGIGRWGVRVFTRPGPRAL
jgi:hypothetical protein